MARLVALPGTPCLRVVPQGREGKGSAVGNESARLLQSLLNGDPELGALIALVEAGTGPADVIEQKVAQWIAANRTRVQQLLLDRLPPVPALRDALPADPALDGWQPRVDLAVATVGVDSPAATLEVEAGTRLVLGLLPPQSATLALEAGPVSGGGTLIVRDPAHSAGALGLRIGPVEVNGFALLDVRDGTVSLMVVLGVRFIPPIQLSFGFALSAVGGVIGVHRRLDSDALRARLADGSAVDALFPSDPAAGAARLLDALAAIFDPATGQHIVGPTFTITWLDIGVTTLVRMDVGVLVQLPDGKVALVGRAKVELPPVLALRLDLFGEIDPGRKLVAVDAVLVDSHALALFRVTGTAAFRSSAADPPYVVAAIGGFYPGFDPQPASVPPQQRVGLALDVPCPLTIRADGYLAITSNTFQVGVDIEAGIDLEVISARGHLRFDAIVQFDPFHLHADYSAGWEVEVAVFSGGTTLSGWIDGPGPWTVHARVSIGLLIDDFTWSDTFTFGPTGPPPDPPIAHLADALAPALEAPSNLRATDAADPLVALTPRAGSPGDGRALCSPVASLVWTQGILPLELPVKRAAGKRLASEQSVRVEAAGTVAQPGGGVDDWFAPGTFLELTQAEAVTLPPFQRMRAGMVVELPEHDGSPAPGSTEYVTFVRRGGPSTPEEETALDGFILSVVMPLRALAMAAGRTARAVVEDRSPLVAVAQEAWVVHAAGGSAPQPSAAHAFLAARSGGIALAATDAPIEVGTI